MLYEMKAPARTAFGLRVEGSENQGTTSSTPVQSIKKKGTLVPYTSKGFQAKSPEPHSPEFRVQGLGFRTLNLGVVGTKRHRARTHGWCTEEHQKKNHTSNSHQ